MKRGWWAVVFAPVLGLAACGGAAISSEEEQPEVAAVVPRDGATGVDPSAPIVLEFRHAMQPGMEQHLSVHEGDASGPAVAGQWGWSADYRTLTFVPATPLRPGTTYSIHMSSPMADGSVMSGTHAQHHGTSGVGMMGGRGMMESDTTSCALLTSFTTA